MTDYTYEPKIVNNFWNTFSENKTLIMRCFNYLYKKLPDHEGRKFSFNNLVLRMYELNVFLKFSLKKIAIKEKKEFLVNKIDLTKKDLIDSGIDVQKKWELFIFNWIEKILKERAYIINKDSHRYVHNATLFDYQLPRGQYCYWIESEYKKYNNDREEDRKGRSTSRRGKIFPPCFNNRVHPSEEFFDDPLDTLLASETHEQILKTLTGKYEKSIYLWLLQGIGSNDIATNLKLSLSHTIRIIRSIKIKIRSNTTTF